MKKIKNKKYSVEIIKEVMYNNRNQSDQNEKYSVEIIKEGMYHNWNRSDQIEKKIYWFFAAHAGIIFFIFSIIKENQIILFNILFGIGFLGYSISLCLFMNALNPISLTVPFWEKDKKIKENIENLENDSKNLSDEVNKQCNKYENGVILFSSNTYFILFVLFTFILNKNIG